MSRCGRCIGQVLAGSAVVVGLVASGAGATVPSHQNGLIAFQRGDDANGQIWVIDPSSSSPDAVQVTSGAEPEAHPAYGPTVDNRDWRLAFQRRSGGDWDIWTRTAQGTAGEQPTFEAPAPLVTGPGDQTEPAYSRVLQSEPLLAYVSDQTGRREIWLRDTAGSLKQLTTDGAGYANPDFAARYRPLDPNGDGTPDGWRIGLAFERTREIWALDLDLDADGAFVGAHDLRVVASGPGELADPSWQTWNPGGLDDPGNDTSIQKFNEILFATAQTGTTYLDFVQETWMADAAGTVTPAIPFADPSAVKRLPLTGNPGGDESAVWAPDGDRVAFVRATGRRKDIWTMAADGSGLERLTSGSGDDVNPSWQPGSESSVDKVDGHAEPISVSRNRRSPRLEVVRARWHGRRIRVAGSSRYGLAGRVRVTFRCGSGASRRRSGLVYSRTGRFTATLRAPRRCRRSRGGRVVVAYGGDLRYTADTASRRVRRR